MKIFYSYSHKDETLRDELEVQLSLLKRQGFIESWHDRRIVPGQDWGQEIEAGLNAADIIILLISADFLASDYCYGYELQKALERHEVESVDIVPIILRACYWQSSPFARFQGLPKDGKPVTSWENRDEAWANVVFGIRTVLSRREARHSVEEEVVISGWRDRDKPQELALQDSSSLEVGVEHAASKLVYGSGREDGLQGQGGFVPSQTSDSGNLWVESGRWVGRLQRGQLSLAERIFLLTFLVVTGGFFVSLFNSTGLVSFVLLVISASFLRALYVIGKRA